MPWNGPFGYAEGFTEALDRMMVMVVKRGVEGGKECCPYDEEE